MSEVAVFRHRSAGHGGGDTVCCRVSMRVQYCALWTRRCADTTVCPDEAGVLLAQAVSDVSCASSACVVTIIVLLVQVKTVCCRLLMQ